MATDTLRSVLARALSWSDAHVPLHDAVTGLAPELRGVRPEGLPHSPWEILEHIRLAQEDILEFCGHSGYRERNWPEDYWPRTPAPPSGAAWDASVAACIADRKALEKLAASSDLEARIPHGSGQTVGRELMLVVDHTAYHVGQLVLVRQLLGAWK